MKIDVRFLMERSHRPEKPSRADVFFVRIGPYPQGESGDPCEQINADLSPPDTTMRYRSVQRRFTLAMSDLFEKYRDLPVVAAVAAWVEWKEVADYDAGEQDSSDSEEESDDVDSEEEKEEHDEAAEEEELLLRAVNNVNKEMTVATDFTYSTSSRPRLEVRLRHTRVYDFALRASPRSFVVVQSFGSCQANLTTHALHISGATQQRIWRYLFFVTSE